MNVLDVQNLQTKIGNKTLISNVSFTVGKGSIVALVGHNGAGKSTLMKTIMGINEKANGKIIIDQTVDQDDAFLDFKKRISYLPEEPLLLTELTTMQHFQLYGMSYGLSEPVLTERIKAYTTGFELTDKIDDYPESLSKGMRQKVQTICALLPDVPLLLIDEPFMGLDIYAIDYFETLIAEKAKEGTGIILTTHQLDRVKNIADHYLTLQHGKLISSGSIDDFTSIKRSTD